MSGYFYNGTGKVHLRPYATPTAPLRYVGNTETVKIGIAEKSEKLEDTDSPGGGVLSSFSRITGATFTLVLKDLRPENLALALGGEATDIAAGSSTDEVVTARTGGLVLLAKSGAASVVVKSQDGLTTYNAETDYVVSGAGITIPEASSIDDGDSLKVSYTYPKQADVQAMLTSGREMFLLFEGVNNAMDGKPLNVYVWRVKFGAAKERDYKGDKFATLELTGELLMDPNQTGDGISKYFKEQAVL
ncbi:MAG: hypothetical protein HQL56_13465 [Magnetococcales bacterium]|nr:hypothetical protein [Magnetococcales bacterium]